MSVTLTGICASTANRTDSLLARLVGDTVKAVSSYKKELESAGVYSYDEGRIFSRRMVKDERLRNIRAQAGSMGGNPVLLGSKDKQKVNQTDNHESKQSPTPSSSSSSLPTGKGKNSAQGACPRPDEVTEKVWNDFLAIRKAKLPRYIRQMRVHYRPNWPCVTELQSSGPGEILSGWSLTETNDGAGGTWMLLRSANPTNRNTSIPFAVFGKLVTFRFNDVINPSNAFSVFEIVNSLYLNTGGQSFTIENTNSLIKSFPVLPFGTPVPWLNAYGYTANYTISVASPTPYHWLFLTTALSQPVLFAMISRAAWRRSSSSLS